MKRRTRSRGASRAKPGRLLFVIMPFRRALDRNAADLTEFFLHNLKSRIESAQSLQYKYTVRRSDDSFNITEQIISDLYEADIVICDLSGQTANPNVMYELGVRLAVTNKPVILIREQSPRNQQVFDIQGFYTHEYNPKQYRALEEYLLEKIRKLESGEEIYQSPVLRVLQFQPSVVLELKRDRAVSLLRMMSDAVSIAAEAMETAVSRFLAAEHGITVPAKRVTSDIVQHNERYQELDWSRLSFRPRILPAIQTFISEPLLAGLVGKGDELVINSFVSRYYAKYFAMESAWNIADVGFLSRFLTETLAFNAALLALQKMLTATNDADYESGRSTALEVLRDAASLPIHPEDDE